MNLAAQHGLPHVTVVVGYAALHAKFAEFSKSLDTWPMLAVKKSFNKAIKGLELSADKLAEVTAAQEFEEQKAVVSAVTRDLYQETIAAAISSEEHPMIVAGVLIDNVLLEFDADRNALVTIIMPDEETAERVRDLLNHL